MSSVTALSFLSQETKTDKETTNIVKKVYNKKEPNIIVNQLYKEAVKRKIEFKVEISMSSFFSFFVFFIAFLGG